MKGAIFGTVKPRPKIQPQQSGPFLEDAAKQLIKKKLQHVAQGLTGSRVFQDLLFLHHAKFIHLFSYSKIIYLN